jgi:catechol 2,3-dioxygenase-like lactoylglutathione lyase family enzyme
MVIIDAEYRPFSNAREGDMKLTSTLIAVEDMERSKRFYHDVLGMGVVADFGANVTLDGGLVLQTSDTWKSFIRTDDVVLPNNAGELYFEEGDLDAFCDRLKTFDVRYVHPLFEHRWGQRVVRFYDPDFHIIEVGEPMDAVIKRLFESGMTVEQVSEKSQYPIEYVKRFAK